MTTYANLKTYAQDNYHDSTDTKAVREIGRFVNDAFRRIARAHDWSFYLKTGRVNTAVKYDTGTVAINTNATALTLSGGTWPLDAVGNHIVVDANSNVQFEVKTRDSGTQVTFKDGQKWLDSNVSGGTYKLYYYVYDLPSNFRKMYDHESEDETSGTGDLYPSPGSRIMTQPDRVIGQIAQFIDADECGIAQQITGDCSPCRQIAKQCQKDHS